jgi:hypothetical protein
MTDIQKEIPVMKNKDIYDLNTIDYYQQDEETINIYRIGYQNETIATIEKYFDEPHFRAFMRWLEEEEPVRKNRKPKNTEQ